ncbi:hypothetical protein ACHAWF_016770 [Thalassiosira exigua]
MEQLSIANARVKAAGDKHKQDYDAIVAELNDKERSIRDRLKDFNIKKCETAFASVELDDDVIVEINAGGKIVSAKRSTLTQLKGTRFDALFSGRWEKKLQRDSNGRIFLDVNPTCFQAIVDCFHELAISSEDDPPSPPSVDEDYMKTIRHQFELFGLLKKTEMPESKIVETIEEADCLHGWLDQDNLDGAFTLLYRSSRDGLSAADFHSKCDNQGCTITVIKTTNGFVLGGYSDVPWTSGSRSIRRGRYRPCALLSEQRDSEKAFLFVLSGSDVSVPCKMKSKNAIGAVSHKSSNGPAFGSSPYDLYMHGSYMDNPAKVGLNLGHDFESGPSAILATNETGHSYAYFSIEEMEVFQVSGLSFSPHHIPVEAQQEVPRIEPVTRFSHEVNETLNSKQYALRQAELEVLDLEESFTDECNFISTFATGDKKDIVTLDVSGTRMTTKRSTLQACKDSVLAQQFDDTKWTAQGCIDPPVVEWTFDKVSSWASSCEGIPANVVAILKENKINGRHLLALNMEGLMLMGIEGAGTLCLLLEEIKKLKLDSSEPVTFIEHSPYCFGKILDCLRMKHLHSQGLSSKPMLPMVRDSEKNRFEKIVKYYFPGDTSKEILG